MSVIAVSKITSKGQITIPREVREQLELHAGDSLEWETGTSGRVVIRKLSGRLKNLVGMLGKPLRSVSIDEMDEGIRAHIVRKHARR